MGIAKKILIICITISFIGCNNLPWNEGDKGLPSIQESIIDDFIQELRNQTVNSRSISLTLTQGEIDRIENKIREDIKASHLDKNSPTLEILKVIISSSFLSLQSQSLEQSRALNTGGLCQGVIVALANNLESGGAYKNTLRELTAHIVLSFQEAQISENSYPSAIYSSIFSIVKNLNILPIDMDNLIPIIHDISAGAAISIPNYHNFSSIQSSMEYLVKGVIEGTEELNWLALTNSVRMELVYTTVWGVSSSYNEMQHYSDITWVAFNVTKGAVMTAEDIQMEIYGIIPPATLPDPNYIPEILSEVIRINSEVFTRNAIPTLDYETILKANVPSTLLSPTQIEQAIIDGANRAIP